MQTNFAYSQDVAFPYMMDPRHEVDTAFVVFESDFRFYERDDIPPSRWLPLCFQKPKEKIAMPPGSRHYNEQRPDEEAIGRHGGLEQPWKAWDLPPTVRDEIHELIAAFNIANRNGAGHVMWAGYNVDENLESGKVNHVGFGAHCIVYTACGARDLLKEMQLGVPNFQAISSTGISDDAHILVRSLLKVV